jgi:hypothetical protein
MIEHILSFTPTVIRDARQELPAGFSQQVLDGVLEGLANMAQRLEKMPPR